jgi:hypothetical protein
MSDAPSDAPAAGVISAVADLLLATRLLCAAGAVAALRALASVFLLLLLPLVYMLLSCRPLTECASAAGADVLWRVTAADAATLLLLLLLLLLSLLVVLSGRAVTRKRLSSCKDRGCTAAAAAGVCDGAVAAQMLPLLPLLCNPRAHLGGSWLSRALTHCVSNSSSSKR